MSWVPHSSEDLWLLSCVCRLWGVHNSYVDAAGETIQAPLETRLRLLESLSGMAIGNSQALRELAHRARQRRFEHWMEPVQVLADGNRPSLNLNLPERYLSNSIRLLIERDDGETWHHEVPASRLESLKMLGFDGEVYHRLQIPLPGHLPYGYHQLIVAAGSGHQEALLIRSPAKVRPETDQRYWGGFIPLYAVRSREDWGIGGLAEMERLQTFVAQQGGALYGTLPMLATDCQGPVCDPSPYSPLSRLFWNEIFLSLPELVQESGNTKAQHLLSNSDFIEEMNRLRSLPHVDHTGVYELKRRVLDILSDGFFACGGDELTEYRSFMRENPEASDYAAFRASDLRGQQYHLYSQYQMDRRLRRLSDRAKRGEIAGLYLDYPVGVSRDGFDARRYGKSFLNGVSAGAPPDAFFSGGQNWGFRPLHPHRLREQGYDYFIKSIRQHMKYAQALRLDHIMAFHRIYAVPDGAEASAGTYIRYCPDEFYAILALEAQRGGTTVIGEDLGTVPPSVRQKLKDKECLRMWVLPFEATEGILEPLQEIPERSMACLNTHDMVPFFGFCKLRDLELYEEIGLLDKERDHQMGRKRPNQIASWMRELGLDPDSTESARKHLLSRLFEELASSRAEFLLLNLEDLWEEVEPQNVPGTWREYPNWKRKARYALEDWEGLPNLRQWLQAITRRRQMKAEPSDRKSGASGIQDENGVSDDREIEK